GEHGGGDARIELSYGEVIQKEQGDRALHGDVIHAVIHQVFAHRVMPAGKESDLQLRPHSIGGADEHGLLPSGKGIAGAEAADVSEHMSRESLARKFFDGRDGAVSFVNADAGVLVAN